MASARHTSENLSGGRFDDGCRSCCCTIGNGCGVSGEFRLRSRCTTATAFGTRCTTAPEIIEENERLKKENAQMNQELNRLRSLCDNIRALTMNYASGGFPEGRALDVMPERQIPSEADVAGGQAQEELISPRLFGVSIGLKRARRNDVE
ncbi:hypothetical protein U1Q18_034100 [Sarracenia purpurea var. burkii]